MKILAYGEDALTLWALQNRLPFILRSLNDLSTPTRCKAFFRPSFGRSGGENSSQFGEFDFILLAENCLYLGESKWNRSSEKIVDGVLTIRKEQLLRHELFKFYVEEWAYGNYSNWHEFVENARPKLHEKGISKPLAPGNSLLAANLQTVLGEIKQHYTTPPTVKNLLMYFFDNTRKYQLPKNAGTDFLVIPIEYSEALLGNFISISG